MDIEGCEKLLEPNSTEIAVKRNDWNLFPLDIQLDVFRCLRDYDLHKKGILVSRQWRGAIERHKGTLPKFRQFVNCRAQNRLIGDNSEEHLRWREELSRRNAEADEKSRRAYKKRINTFVLLSITSFIAALVAQLGHISIERIVTTFLLLAVTLRMFNAYDKLHDRYEYSFRDWRILGLPIDTGYGNIESLKHLMPAYLGIRALVFVIIGILRHMITGNFSGL
ncbi:hypothetical protein DdX_20999 [Ditylenchus destructor]|uniref:F-box domain-containing protein n=1 Tax=Ditylenchus destructor TaxID=166010 RepID=A0AAD4MGC8_9BILA|nr:hypothetical protein DdX_20999 [Ditylenchus destructor]